MVGIKENIKIAASTGAAAHKTEKMLFHKMFQLCREFMDYFFTAQGDGNLGEEICLEDTAKLQRLNKEQKRYVSIFGNFILERYRYGTREKQKIEFIPFDTRLQLPESEYSFFLQELSQIIAVETPFAKTKEFLEKIFPIKVTVDSLERINQKQAQDVAEYNTKTEINSEQEEAFLVHSADGKGVSIRHKKDVKRIEEHKHKKGPKPDRKRMAVVGAVYSISPYERTPEQIVEALFRDPSLENKRSVPKRPKPQNKQLVANLTRQINGETVSALSETFAWMKTQNIKRDETEKKKHIALMDGQPSLWKELHRQFGKGKMIEILDLLHVTPRLWDAANIFYPKDESEKIIFMEDRVLKILKGEAKSVITGLLRMASLRKLSSSKKKKLQKACAYLKKNISRMKYNEYISLGLPIASGVIEGACRHFVKDRMERAGMHWSINGAQAMLDLRSIYLNGFWDDFTEYHIQKEIHRSYPHQNILEKISWPMAA